MKYIKNFEGFGHIDLGTDLYKQIDYLRYERILYDNIPAPITSLETDWFINIVKSKLLDKFKIVKYTECKRMYIDEFNSVVYIDISPNKNVHDNTGFILLYKFEDDYWTIETNMEGDAWFDGGSDFTYWVVDSKEGIEDWANYYFNEPQKQEQLYQQMKDK